MNVSKAKQKLILEYLISNTTAFTLCRPILKAEYFEDELKGVARFIIQYADEYNNIPAIDVIEVETGVVLSHKDEVASKESYQWVCDEVESFCRIQATVAAIYNALDVIEAKDDLASIVDPMKEAVNLKLKRNLGVNFFHDPVAQLKALLDHAQHPTGFRDLDKWLYGGVYLGGLNLFLAGSGVGKSWALANTCVNMMQEGHDCLYVSLELAEDHLTRRFVQLTAGLGSQHIFNNLPLIQRTIHNRKEEMGGLWITRIKSGSTAMDIEALLRDFEIEEGFRPKAIFIDYLDKMHPVAPIRDFGDLWTKDKYVCEELREMFHQWELIGWSASQLGRGAKDQEDISQSDIAGGISKINESDVVVALRQDEKLRERCLYEAKILKTRNSIGTDMKFKIAYNQDTMRMYDYNETESAIDEDQENKPARKSNRDRINSIKGKLSK